ncbi:anthrone oxygenase family protein [Paraglaciecola sp.]|uniref:anthrone oxygenase family protein n=1 Tax=Paraglaciecola sp. TaxID=1920173 RepID=UPI003264BDAD
MSSLIIAIFEATLQLTMIIMVGLYFVFSNTVMPVLAKHHDGAATMIKINKKILNPLFMICFISSGLAGLYFFLLHTGFLAAAGIVFFIGTTIVTIVFNVPLNDRLKNSLPQKRDEEWIKYLSKWVAWNHVRTLSGIVSAFLLAL